MRLGWFRAGTGQEEGASSGRREMFLDVGPSLHTRVFQFDWSQSEPIHSIFCIPAIALPLILSIHFGHPASGVLMATGAMCVGFGSFQKPLFSRSGPMLAAGVGITISATTGALAEHSTLALVIITALWAFLYGISSAISPVAAWVGLQCCIYLIISSAALAAKDGTHNLVTQALLRGAGILLGSVIQYTFIRLLWFFVPRATPTYSDTDFDPKHYGWAYIQQQFTMESFYFRFALRLTITAIISVTLYRYLHFNNAYWIAMTAMILPHPELVLTTIRTINRFTGTLLGAGLATVLAVFLRPSGNVLSALVILFAWLSYAVGSVNYGVFVVALTGYIAFLLAIMRAPEGATLTNRIFATFIGGAIGITIHLISIPINRAFIERRLEFSARRSAVISDGVVKPQST